MKPIASTEPDHGFRIGGASVQEIAARFGTPAYVFDAERARARYLRMRKAIAHRPLRLHYSVKAQANVALLRVFAALGAGVDACSVGDIALAREAGFEPQNISFTACGLADEELRAVHACGAFFIGDSLDQLERYGRLGGGRSVGLRLNVRVDAGFHPHVRSGGERSKFGVQRHQLGDAVVLARRLSLRLTWLHAHIGSDILDLEAPLAVVDRLLEAGNELPDLEAIDVGGGWGVPFDETAVEFDVDAYGSMVTDKLAAYSARTGRELTMVLEPGAYLMQDAGFLVTRVNEIKPGTSFDGLTTPHFAYVDSNSGQVISSLLYGTRRHLRAVAGSRRPTRSYDVCGNLMQAGDILGKDVELPELVIGDILVVEDAGSYCACRASSFNERPRPAEVIVDGGRPRLARRAETVADLIAFQVTEMAYEHS